MATIPASLPNPFIPAKPPTRRKPTLPKGPRNLKKHGFTNGLWRLNERDNARKPRK